MAPFFSDAFTDTDAVQLQSHTPDVGTSWTRLWSDDATLDFVITTNRVNPEMNPDSGVMYTADATYPSADYKITVTMVGVGTSARSYFLLLRVADQENMYALRGGGSGAGTAQLYKKVAGTWSTIGTAFTGPAAGSVVEFEIIGDTLKVRDDSSEIASETDTDLTAAGKAGLAAGGGAELVTSTDDAHTAVVFDTFSVDDLGSGGTAVKDIIGAGFIPFAR